jgi:hypothetical protein
MSTHTHIHTLAVAASMLICDGSNIWSCNDGAATWDTNALEKYSIAGDSSATIAGFDGVMWTDRILYDGTYIWTAEQGTWNGLRKMAKYNIDGASWDTSLPAWGIKPIFYDGIDVWCFYGASQSANPTLARFKQSGDVPFQWQSLLVSTQVTGGIFAGRKAYLTLASSASLTIFNTETAVEEGSIPVGSAYAGIRNAVWDGANIWFPSTSGGSGENLIIRKIPT